MGIRRYHDTWRMTAVACLLIGMVWAVLARAGAVQAVVSDTLVTNCTGTGLANAMNSGSGLITFS
jgi:hypothetical protein